ncbi:hypothetical protein HELRODRAFT_171977 [Helobdella robusta]|uniref:WSC domain-containing protein n=1 Tax=Helobdella robusta TaxID=6412 RepID=T1F4W8_HELRO|nr:hypothetical protein HELRODRAFT_171977 [Helobdella robusta]ESO04969.1 hypothetical protein HELRODRAFT_171977 [Helobdella robusta]
MVYMKKGTLGLAATDGDKSTFAIVEAHADAWFIVDLLVFFHVQQISLLVFQLQPDSKIAKNGLDNFTIGRLDVKQPLTVLYTFKADDFKVWYTHAGKVEAEIISIDLKTSNHTARFVAIRQSAIILGSSGTYIKEFEAYGVEQHVEAYKGCYKTLKPEGKPTVVQTIHSCFDNCSSRPGVEMFGLKDGKNCYCTKNADTLVASTFCQIPCPNNTNRYTNEQIDKHTTAKPKVSVDIINYLGCFADNVQKKAGLMGELIDRDNVTIEKCIKSCRSKYVAVQEIIFRNIFYDLSQEGKLCACADGYSGRGPSSECNMPCVGNPRQTCGGKQANQVYENCQKFNCSGECHTSDLATTVFSICYPKISESEKKPQLKAWVVVVGVVAAALLVVALIAIGYFFYIKKRKVAADTSEDGDESLE